MSLAPGGIIQRRGFQRHLDSELTRISKMFSLCVCVCVCACVCTLVSLVEEKRRSKVWVMGKSTVPLAETRKCGGDTKLGIKLMSIGLSLR